MVLIILLATSIFLYLFYDWLKRRNADYWEKRNIPFVSKKNAFGILWDYFIGDRSLAEVYKDVYDKYPTEPQVGLFLGAKPALLIRDPKNIQAIFANDFQSFHSRGLITNPNDLLADNILFMEDYRKWKVVRQKISPLFTGFRLKAMFFIMERCASDFVKLVEENEKLRKMPFKLLYTYTTAALGASIFGIETKTENTMDSPFQKMSWQTVNPSFKSNFKFFLANTFPAVFRWLRIKIFGEHEKFFIGVVKDVLKQRRSEHVRRFDFIALCLELLNNGVMQDPMTGIELIPTEELMAAQAFFFFVAGSDTSANAMHFTLLELANNPQILEKLQKEIDAAFDKSDDNITYEDIDRMMYMDCVIYEAMRKYPPIGLIQRKCTKDTVLPVGNLKVDKDVVTITPVYAIHKDPKCYPDPEVFDPERFRATKMNFENNYTYLAFGEGNRFCIGSRFARLQVKCGLAWLLRKFTLEPQSETPKRFEKSFFSLRATDANFNLIPRT